MTTPMTCDNSIEVITLYFAKFICLSLFIIRSVVISVLWSREFSGILNARTTHLQTQTVCRCSSTLHITKVLDAGILVIVSNASCVEIKPSWFSCWYFWASSQGLIIMHPRVSLPSRHYTVGRESQALIRSLKECEEHSPMTLRESLLLKR